MLLQVYFSPNGTHVLGLLQILGSIGYLVVSVLQIIEATRPPYRRNPILFRILQVLFAPVTLFTSGTILIFQGWQLDLSFQFQQFLISILLVYLIFLDLQRSSRFYQE